VHLLYTKSLVIKQPYQVHLSVLKHIYFYWVCNNVKTLKKVYRLFGFHNAREISFVEDIRFLKKKTHIFLFPHLSDV